MCVFVGGEGTECMQNIKCSVMYTLFGVVSEINVRKLAIYKVVIFYTSTWFP